ncbi:hypothetical protein NSQ41_15965 [Aeribacillus sp. FSL K6-8210]|uniref:hypothetical protein n=1 Tax=Aeribacillus TaxID=1055323 RepID=UPI0030CE519D
MKTGNLDVFGEKLKEMEKDLKKLAEMYTERTKSLLESVTNEDLDRQVDLSKIFGAKMSGSQ